MYDDHYGLTGRPFQLTPDPAFYFESATHRKAMAYLGYGLAQGEGFIVITGDIGAGKTTLVGHLMATVDKARLHAVKITSTQVGGDDILRLAAQAFGIASEGLEKAQILSRVEGFLYEQARVARRTLLIVDEAQNLPISALEELRMLSNFQSGGQALLQIFLLGQPEFRDKLKDGSLEQLRQRVIATHHLDPMNESEVGPYIEHRLKLVGWTGRPRFTADAYAALYSHTDGVPRRVNALVGRVLLLGAVERLDVIDGAIIDSVVADQAEEDAVPATPAATVEPAPVAPAAAPEPVADNRPRIAFGLAEARGDGPRVVHSVVEPPQDTALVERIAALEARVEEQDAALRRVLTLLVDWVERDGNVARPGDAYRHSAA